MALFLYYKGGPPKNRSHPADGQGRNLVLWQGCSRPLSKKGQAAASLSHDFFKKQEYFSKTPPKERLLWYTEENEGEVSAIKICCFTGHRTVAPRVAVALSTALDAHLLRLAEEGYTEFRAGGARGFDTLAALRVLQLKKHHPAASLHLILPCRDQAASWRAGERAVWEELLARADQVSFLRDTYTADCMHARNRALVDGSSTCIAYLTANRGGTLYTCTYALKRGLELINLAEEL